METLVNAKLPAKAELLRLLTLDDSATLKRVLFLPCPCRNLHYDPEVWFEMARVCVEHSDWYVREGAMHAIVTLKDRSRFDTRAVVVLRWLAEEGFNGGVAQPRWLRQERARTGTDRPLKYPKVARRDVPTLIEALSSDDAADQQDALRALCPGPDRRYNARVWQALVQATSVQEPVSRAHAQAALDRLLEHARADRHAHDIIRRLFKSEAPSSPLVASKPRNRPDDSGRRP